MKLGLSISKMGVVVRLIPEERQREDRETQVPPDPRREAPPSVRWNRLLDVIDR